MENFFITVLLVVICDREMAKKNDLTIEDILKDPNLTNLDLKNLDFYLRDELKVIAEQKAYIPCGSECIFQTHKMKMCFRFKSKMDVCILNKDVTGEKSFFNIGKFMFLTVASYMDWTVPLRTETGFKKFGFGSEPNIPSGDVGYSVIIQKMFAQTAYRPKVQPITVQDINCVVAALRPPAA